MTKLSFDKSTAGIVKKGFKDFICMHPKEQITSNVKNNKIYVSYINEAHSIKVN